MITVYARRNWLDNVDEAAAQYPHAPRPTRVERWVGSYFTEWLEEARRADAARMKHADVTEHPGFGKQHEAYEAALAQWLGYVGELQDDTDAEAEDNDDATAVALAEDDED